jgi:hypothetical protein
VKDSNNVFRTFCHINEYDLAGYAELHRMIATSAPVVLWAPSSMLLQIPSCRISEKEFVKYVDDRVVRVIGRRDWLLSRDYRNRLAGEKWEGAQWNPAVDDALRSMALEDEGSPLPERRVAIASDERGVGWADEYVEKNPSSVAAIAEILTGPDAESNMPIGVVASARKHAQDPEGLAKRILRDAYNHSEAIAVAGSRTPFLLQQRESSFLQLLRTLCESEKFDGPSHTPSRTLSMQEMADLTQEVLSVLRHLDSARRTTSLNQFVANEGHQLLATWLSEICQELVEDEANNVRGKVVRSLQRDFDTGRLENSLKDVLTNRDAIIGWTGDITSTIDPALSRELKVLGLVGLLAGVYGLQRNIRQLAGFAPGHYSGPQWAFLYTFGTRATGRSHRIMRNVLDNLGS